MAPNLNRTRAVRLPVSSGLDHSQSSSDSTNRPASGGFSLDALRASARSKLHVDPEGAWRGGDRSPQEMKLDYARRSRSVNYDRRGPAKLSRRFASSSDDSQEPMIQAIGCSTLCGQLELLHLTADRPTDSQPGCRRSNEVLRSDARCDPHRMSPRVIALDAPTPDPRSETVKDIPG